MRNNWKQRTKRAAVRMSVENILDGPESATEAQILQTEAENGILRETEDGYFGEMG
jgi:hypothetical protein